MFQSQKNQDGKAAKKATPGRDAGAVTILTSGCHFSGKLFCRGASRIGGRIEGQIVSEGLLIIEEEAVITAEIKAEEVIIQGRVHGKLQASGRVELTASSQFEGDIVTPILVVREGAQFNGNSAMVKRDDAAATKAPRIMTVGAKGAKSFEPHLPEIGNDTRLDVTVHSTPEINAPGI